MLDFGDLDLLDTDAERTFVVYCFHSLIFRSHRGEESLERRVCNCKTLSKSVCGDINHLFTSKSCWDVTGLEFVDLRGILRGWARWVEDLRHIPFSLMQQDAVG